MLPEDFQQDPTLLTGEHVMPEWFDTDQELRPWKEVANLIANHPWPKLYDADALRAAKVPCAAAVYHDDAYVPRQFSVETAALLPQMHAWVTTEYEHNGSNASGGAVLPPSRSAGAGDTTGTGGRGRAGIGPGGPTG